MEPNFFGLLKILSLQENWKFLKKTQFCVIAYCEGFTESNIDHHQLDLRLVVEAHHWL